MTASSSLPGRSPAWTSKPSVALLAVLMTAVGVAGAADPNDQPLAVLERIANQLKSRPVWHARYEQEYVPAGMSMGEETSGELWLGWPDRALFVQGDPVQRLTGLSGHHVRLVDLEVGSCEDHVLTEEEWQRTPLVAVVDPAAALKVFTLLSAGERRVALVPREPGGVRRVELEAGSDGMPAEVEVVDPQGAVNRLRFSGWEAASSPPDGRWLPQAPPGLHCSSDTGDSAGDPG